MFGISSHPLTNSYFDMVRGRWMYRPQWGITEVLRRIEEYDPSGNTGVFDQTQYQERIPTQFENFGDGAARLIQWWPLSSDDLERLMGMRSVVKESGCKDCWDDFQQFENQWMMERQMVEWRYELCEDGINRQWPWVVRVKHFRRMFVGDNIRTGRAGIFKCFFKIYKVCEIPHVHGEDVNCCYFEEYPVCTDPEVVGNVQRYLQREEDEEVKESGIPQQMEEEKLEEESSSYELDEENFTFKRRVVKRMRKQAEKMMKPKSARDYLADPDSSDDQGTHQ